MSKNRAKNSKNAPLISRLIHDSERFGMISSDSERFGKHSKRFRKDKK